MTNNRKKISTIRNSFFVISYQFIVISACAPHKRQALYRRYGRFFAEFLSEKSLVPLGLLALSTSVGLRYDTHTLNLEAFLGRLFDAMSEVKPRLTKTHAMHH